MFTGRKMKIVKKGSLVTAIRLACDQLGFRSSLEAIQDRTQDICGRRPDVSYACTVRKNYEHEKNQVVDDRTYEGQPDRNMVAQSAAKISAGKYTKALQLAAWMKANKFTAEDVKNALAEQKELRKMVAA